MQQHVNERWGSGLEATTTAERESWRIEGGNEKVNSRTNTIPSVGRGFLRSFRISGLGIMLPDAAPPMDTLTFVPSSKNLCVTLQGALPGTPHHNNVNCSPMCRLTLQNQTLKSAKNSSPTHRVNELHVGHMQRGFHGHNSTGITISLLNVLLHLQSSQGELSSLCTR